MLEQTTSAVALAARSAGLMVTDWYQPCRRAHPAARCTYTDDRMGEHYDVRYAERVAADNPPIAHAWVHGTRSSVQHFDALDDPAVLLLTDAPSLSLGLLAIKAAKLAPATTYGSHLHLTGRGGDNVLDALPMSVIDQYRAGHRLAAVGRTARLARARHTALWPMLRQAARTQQSSQPRALRALAELIGGPGVLRHPSWAPPWEMLSWCGITAAATWLTRAGRAVVAELVATRSEAAAPDVHPGALHERLALEHMGGGRAGFDQIARQQWHLPIHVPLLDTPVVDACLALPGYERFQPGDYKPLARAAFTGHVPNFLLQRSTKTAFTGSLYAGLHTNAPTLRRILTTSRIAQAGLLDPAAATAAAGRRRPRRAHPARGPAHADRHRAVARHPAHRLRHLVGEDPRSQGPGGNAMRNTIGIYAATSTEDVALMDVRTGRGQWRFLDPIGDDLWRTITDGATPADAIERVPGCWSSRGADPQQVAPISPRWSRSWNAPTCCTPPRAPPTLSTPRCDSLPPSRRVCCSGWPGTPGCSWRSSCSGS
ncbi:asparagine synthase-related protein [Streptomyces sp. NPDC059003]|uniref:asparagine synthase-related protein n=1 Tax=Streptomyces sp. NPDC059003 TaxID=3346691 RepID=UPI00368B5AD7